MVHKFGWDPHGFAFCTYVATKVSLGGGSLDLEVAGDAGQQQQCSNLAGCLVLGLLITHCLCTQGRFIVGRPVCVHCGGKVCKFNQICGLTSKHRQSIQCTDWSLVNER